jgi:pyrimidine deaminase RibD-like protein
VRCAEKKSFERERPETISGFFSEGDAMSENVKYMKRALDLAKQGLGHTGPNPMVGAVIVKEGRIIGEGYHQRYGCHHAEINALLDASESVQGATMYVTLEPCSHHGKTPPCADAIVKHGLKQVVVASVDPNPLVSGRGLERLKQAGIAVKTGVLDDESQALNPIFFNYIQTRLPYVLIEDPSAEARYSELRQQASAILLSQHNLGWLKRHPIAKHIKLYVAVDELDRLPRLPENAYALVSHRTDPARLTNVQATRNDHTGDRLNLQALLAELGSYAIDSLLIPYDPGFKLSEVTHPHQRIQPLLQSRATERKALCSPDSSKNLAV